MKVTVDKDVCIGCELCGAICDSVFSMNDEGLAEVNEKSVDTNEMLVREAVESCPVEAIKIV